MPTTVLMTGDDLAAAHDHYRAGRSAEAESACRAVLRRRPGHAGAVHLLGRLAWDAGRGAEALDLFRQAARLAQQVPDFHNSLGTALAEVAKDTAGALAAFARALQLRPGYVEAHRNRGLCLRAAGRLREAQAAFRRALELEPSAARTWLDLAEVCWRRGDVRAAAEGHRRAAQLLPDNPIPASDYLHLLHYDPDCTPERLFAEAVEWGKRFDRDVGGGEWGVGSEQSGVGGGEWGVRGARSGALDVERRTSDVGRSEQAAPPAGERPTLDVQRPTSNIDRPLRVGYVSGDFRNHPVGRFIAPILAGHDRANVVVYCYGHVSKPDAVTERLRTLACAWRDTLGLDCAALAERVRQDRIDVLVDLTGHLGDHRLLAFARRPAPVQVSYLGYPDTTGMRSIQYRITDSAHDPVGQTEQWHTEQLVRLPRCCWAYDPGDAPDANDLPALSSGHVTFGCLNRVMKITPAMMRLWARILDRVPGSKLMALIDGASARDADLQERFRAGGIDPSRMIVSPRRPRPDYLRLFQQVDVCLDTFPYNGHTTTLDALWMGVPTVSLTGRTHVQRAGLSVLSAVGLEELAPATEDGYVETAVTLAHNLPRLAESRRTLRSRMAASPLCHGPGLARALESAYRGMWRAWCGAV